MGETAREKEEEKESDCQRRGSGLEAAEEEMRGEGIREIRQEMKLIAAPECNSWSRNQSRTFSEVP